MNVFARGLHTSHISHTYQRFICFSPTMYPFQKRATTRVARGWRIFHDVPGIGWGGWLGASACFFLDDLFAGFSFGLEMGTCIWHWFCWVFMSLICIWSVAGCQIIRITSIGVFVNGCFWFVPFLEDGGIWYISERKVWEQDRKEWKTVRNSKKSTSILRYRYAWKSRYHNYQYIVLPKLPISCWEW